MGLLEKVRAYLADALERVAPQLDRAREKAAPHVERAREKAAPHLDKAREKAAPHVDKAREKAAPHLDKAREKASPLVDRAASKVDHATGGKYSDRIEGVKGRATGQGGGRHGSGDIPAVPPAPPGGDTPRPQGDPAGSQQRGPDRQDDPTETGRPGTPPERHRRDGGDVPPVPPAG